MKCERGKEARTLASRERRAKQVQEDGFARGNPFLFFRRGKSDAFILHSRDVGISSVCRSPIVDTSLVHCNCYTDCFALLDYFPCTALLLAKSISWIYTCIESSYRNRSRMLPVKSVLLHSLQESRGRAHCRPGGGESIWHRRSNPWARTDQTGDDAGPRRTLPR